MPLPRRLGLAITTMALAALAGCGDDGGPPASCLPACAADRGYDAIAYHLSARFDWPTTTLHAVEDLTVIPGASPIIELDAEVEVTEVHAGGQRLAFASDRDRGTLHVDLGPIVGAGGAVDFTVEYTVGLSDALVIGGPRDDDPVAARVVYTDSEPDRGRRWLVGKHEPSDRARWSVDVTVPPDHDVVANGARAGDQAVAGQRLVSYHLDQPIPTYLMAFAAGELDHVERTDGRVPLALWFRRGLAVAPDDNLDAVADAMATFERLIGPYPWERYAVVLLPGFGGGMENATLTFNDETSGQGAVSFNLNAHELAHQWFGDWVTMRSYDDVWVKEGMATFLAAEATRARRDQAQVGRFFSTDFPFRFVDAIVDPELTGLAKYTSGPYQRAAWLITQVRTVVGDDALWAGLRRVLTEHAVGDLDGAGFLASFPLPDATRQRLLASLPAKGVPGVEVAATTAAGVTTATLTLVDDAGVVAAPVDLAVIDAAGVATTATLVAGTPITVTVPAGGYLAPDPRGVHPWTSTFDVSTAYFDELVPRFLPSAAPARAELLRRSASHQEVALRYGAPLPAAAEFAAFYDGLDSVEAQRYAVAAACRLLPTLPPADAAVLTTALVPRLVAPPVTRFLDLGSCGPTLSEQALGPELAAAVTAPTAATAARLDYLLGFDYGPALSLARIGQVATAAPSLRLRELALNRLVSQTNPNASYTAIPGAERPAWRAWFRGHLPRTTTARRLATLWAAVVNLDDVLALPGVAPLLHTVPMSEDFQQQLVCEAHQLAVTTPGAWAGFQAATMPWSTLSAAAAAALADPATCPAGKPVAAPVRDDAADDHVRHLPR